MEGNDVIVWLLEGDPAIRWQVLRDLCRSDEITYCPERRKIAQEGWGACLLSHQDASGTWGGQLYSNKWLSTTYTLLLLRRLGLEPQNHQAHKACRRLIDGGYREGGAINLARTVSQVDNAVTGMVLSLLAYFGFPDERVHAIASYLSGQQRPDGSWEPYNGNQNLKYTFDATLLVLEGLREYEKRYPDLAQPAIAAQQQGREFLLKHRLFKCSPPGDEPVDRKMLRFSFPPRWHYDVLAALDYFQECRPENDPRLEDSISLLQNKRALNGTWTLQNRHAGKTFFEMEKTGKPSRWNTLRGLRVLKWWQGEF